MSDSTRLFVGNLSWDTNVDSLKAAFHAHGKVSDATIICKTETKLSRLPLLGRFFFGPLRCFGLIKYSSKEEADAALNKMRGVLIDGRAVRVHRAKGHN